MNSIEKIVEEIENLRMYAPGFLRTFLEAYGKERYEAGSLSAYDAVEDGVDELDIWNEEKDVWTKRDIVEFQKEVYDVIFSLKSKTTGV